MPRSKLNVTISDVNVNFGDVSVTLPLLDPATNAPSGLSGYDGSKLYASPTLNGNVLTLALSDLPDPAATPPAAGATNLIVTVSYMRATRTTAAQAITYLKTQPLNHTLKLSSDFSTGTIFVDNNQRQTHDSDRLVGFVLIQEQAEPQLFRMEWIDPALYVDLAEIGQAAEVVPPPPPDNGADGGVLGPMGFAMP